MYYRKMYYVSGNILIFFLINKRTLIFRAIWVTHLELMKFLFSNIYRTMRIKFSFFFFLLSLAVLGLQCCVWAFSSCSKWGLLFVALLGLLIVMAFLAAEYRLQALDFQQLKRLGSEVVAHGLSCPEACGIISDQRLNSSPALAGRFLPSEPPGKSKSYMYIHF